MRHALFLFVWCCKLDGVIDQGPALLLGELTPFNHGGIWNSFGDYFKNLFKIAFGMGPLLEWNIEGSGRGFEGRSQLTFPIPFGAMASHAVLFIEFFTLRQQFRCFFWGG